MNFATIISTNFNAILATLSVVVGTFLDAVFSWIGQRKSFERKIKWEQLKIKNDKLEQVVFYIQ